MIKMGKICYVIVFREINKQSLIKYIIVRKYRRLFRQKSVDVKTINEKF